MSHTQPAYAGENYEVVPDEAAASEIDKQAMFHFYSRHSYFSRYFLKNEENEGLVNYAIGERLGKIASVIGEAWPQR